MTGNRCLFLPRVIILEGNRVNFDLIIIIILNEIGDLYRVEPPILRAETVTHFGLKLRDVVVALKAKMLRDQNTKYLSRYRQRRNHSPRKAVQTNPSVLFLGLASFSAGCVYVHFLA